MAYTGGRDKTQMKLLEKNTDKVLNLLRGNCIINCLAMNNYTIR